MFFRIKITDLSLDFYKNTEKILVATDCIIFGFDGQSIKLLLFKRRVEPFRGSWSLIGSFVRPQENVQDAALRVLEESTGLRNIFMEEFGVFGMTDRDPGARVISLGYYALIRIDEQNSTLLAENQAQWFDFENLPDLILDHTKMVESALSKLRGKARYRPVGFELLPEKFTLPKLRRFYESIYGRELDRRNFRKKILSMDILEKLEEKDKTESRKGAFFYKFIKEKYDEMVEKGVNFEM